MQFIGKKIRNDVGMKQDEIEQKIYLKGYKEGFESALKVSWACAEELLIQVNNEEKPKVQDLINKLKN